MYLTERGLAPKTYQGLYFLGIRYGLSKKDGEHVYFSKQGLVKYANAVKSPGLPPGWMTVAEASDYYKTSRQCVYMAIKEKRIQSRTIGIGMGTKVVNTNGIHTILKRENHVKTKKTK